MLLVVDLLIDFHLGDTNQLSHSHSLVPVFLPCMFVNPTDSSSALYCDRLRSRPCVCVSMLRLCSSTSGGEVPPSSRSISAISRAPPANQTDGGGGGGDTCGGGVCMHGGGGGHLSYTQGAKCQDDGAPGAGVMGIGEHVEAL